MYKARLQEDAQGPSMQEFFAQWFENVKASFLEDMRGEAETQALIVIRC